MKITTPSLVHPRLRAKIEALLLRHAALGPSESVSRIAEVDTNGMLVLTTARLAYLQDAKHPRHSFRFSDALTFIRDVPLDAVVASIPPGTTHVIEINNQRHENVNDATAFVAAIKVATQSLALSTRPVETRTIIIKEIVKVPCPFCGVLVEITSSTCPQCKGNVK